jgi:FAD/FMN-containing dehydrogenase
MRRLAPPRDRRGRFVNWAGTVTSTPAAWHEPAREDEVASIVRDAARAGKRVRVVGAGHSWSAIAAPDDDQHAVTLDRLAGIRRADDGTVTIGAGTRLRDLNAALAARGLALPIVGSIAHQAMAGAIATGTHGSSLVHGNLASGVVSMRLVDGRGDVIAIERGDPRLDGARVHLGTLGVITELTLRVVPAFRLAERVEAVPIAAACADVERIARSAEYVKIWWLPHTRRALVYRYQRTDAPATRTATLGRWLDERVVHGAILPRALALHARRPAWIPGWNRAVVRAYEHARPRVAPSALCLSTPMPAVHRETEAAVPLARAGVAVERVVRLIEEERIRVNFILEIRFVRGDEGWMSPAHGGDVAQIGAYTGQNPDAARYFAGFWRELRALGARPHWGKEMDHGADELRALYPMAARFAALRDALDPDRVFGSAFHARVLGP